jgi:hypothetical protein
MRAAPSHPGSIGNLDGRIAICSAARHVKLGRELGLRLHEGGVALGELASALRNGGFEDATLQS